MFISTSCIKAMNKRTFLMGAIVFQRLWREIWRKVIVFFQTQNYFCFNFFFHSIKRNVFSPLNQQFLRETLPMSIKDQGWRIIMEANQLQVDCLVEAVILVHLETLELIHCSFSLVSISSFNSQWESEEECFPPRGSGGWISFCVLQSVTLISVSRTFPPAERTRLWSPPEPTAAAVWPTSAVSSHTRHISSCVYVQTSAGSFKVCVSLAVCSSSCPEMPPLCWDGEVLTVDGNVTDRCCPAYQCGKSTNEYD